MPFKTVFLIDLFCLNFLQSMKNLRRQVCVQGALLYVKTIGENIQKCN